MGKLISIIEASRRFGLTEQTLRNWIKEGHISFKSVGKSRYIDEDTINVLQDTVEDIKRQKARLERLLEESREEVQNRFKEREEEKRRKRYLNLMVGAAMRSGFYEKMTHLMHAYGILNEREMTIIVDFLYGGTLESIGDKYGLTRERTRQIVEKAIRKSTELTTIEEKLDEMKQMQLDIETLKKNNENLREQLRKFVEYVPPVQEEVEENERLCALLSTRLVDCDLSVRALNCLKSGRTDRKFSFGKMSARVIVPECETIGDLCRLQKTDFLKIRNAGKKSLQELDKFLTDQGLSWGMDVDSIYQKRAEMILYGKTE